MIEKRNGKYVLRMVQGDTEPVTVLMEEVQTDDTFITKNFVAGDKVTLAAKKIGATGTLFTPIVVNVTSEVETVTLNIPSSATKNVEASDFDYVFDVEADLADGTVAHLVEKSPFVLIERCGD